MDENSDLCSHHQQPLRESNDTNPLLFKSITNLMLAMDQPHPTIKNKNDVHINKVGSYADLRSNSNSVSNAFLNNTTSTTTTTTTITNPSHKRCFLVPNSFTLISTSTQQSPMGASLLTSSRSSMSLSSSSSSSEDEGRDQIKPRKTKRIKLDSKRPNELDTVAVNQPVSNTQNSIKLNVNVAKSRLKSLHQKLNKKMSIRKVTTISSANGNVLLSNPMDASINSAINYHQRLYKVNKMPGCGGVKSKKYLMPSGGGGGGECVLSGRNVGGRSGSLGNFSQGTGFESRQSLNEVKQRAKCLLVGDSSVGKSALICWFLKRVFLVEYQPTVVDDYEGDHRTLFSF
jgi:hypothetical protein